MDIDTPGVAVDLDVVERNISAFQAYCDQHELNNRPHIKTHKNVQFARLQAASGCAGITCQKLGEAEVMADAGLEDILITYNILGAAKLERAVALRRRIELSVTCDNAIVADGLSEAMARADLTLPVLVECDSGAGRCGVQTPDEAIGLAERIDRLPGLAFNGFMTFPTPGAAQKAGDFFAACREKAETKGLRGDVLSSGGTPDMWHAAEVEPLNEYRAGTYIYYDRSQVRAGACTFDDCALTVEATIVSRPTEERAILDCGSKTLSSDLFGLEGYGYIREYPEAHMPKLTEEHGFVDLSRSNRRPRVGERVSIVPNHCCVVSNLHDQIHGLRGDDVEQMLTVDARGLSR